MFGCSSPTEVYYISNEENRKWVLIFKWNLIYFCFHNQVHALCTYFEKDDAKIHQTTKTNCSVKFSRCTIRTVLDLRVVGAFNWAKWKKKIEYDEVWWMQEDNFHIFIDVNYFLFVQNMQTLYYGKFSWMNRMTFDIAFQWVIVV